MNSADVLVYYRSRKEQITAEMREIVDIESPSRNGSASRRMAHWVEQQAQATGVELTVERRSVDHGEHLIISAFPGDGPRTLLLGHTDTVHPTGTAAQNPTRVEGDKFYGCGIFDMKANIVLAIEALRFFAEHDIKAAGPVTMLLSCDEEIGSHTGRELVEEEAAAADRCFVLEPSANGKVKTGRKGTGMFTLKAHGKPAHAGLEPEKGANAILELSRHISEVQDLAGPEEGTTVNVCTIKGGTATNVIPEYAECQIDARFTTMEEGERVTSSLNAIKPLDERVSLELIGGINRPPLERTSAVVELFRQARSIASSYSYHLDETQVGGASDGNFVGAIGVPVLDGLGVTGAGAHTLDEYILVSDIAPRSTLLTLLLAGS